MNKHIAINKQQIEDRMQFVLTGEMKNRVRIKWQGDELLVTVDLHGLNRKEADRLIRNIIAIQQIPFKFDLIHGYNHGTVLKKHIHKSLNSPKIKKKYCKPYNPGETHLLIA